MPRLFIAILATLTLSVLGGSWVSAHDEFRIIGTLTRVQSHQIDVKQKDNKTFYIKVDKNTLITRDKKEVPVSELKNGRSVVVQALGDDETDLLALEVRLVPDIKNSGRKYSWTDYLVFPALGCFVGGALGGVVLIVMGGTSSVPSGVRTDVATITQSPP